ncbi:hypothetical protein A4V15_20670 [Pseudomonas oryzihabitans]|uniref:Uncharacterized protein n=1 Tax=Pseudomonas oryzihabitans TaxID=47885 RepID=A0A178LF34_9PSED|nr:hypothetical protein A4V15_20670 [Pseudomonas oryzihabitans]
MGHLMLMIAHQRRVAVIGTVIIMRVCAVLAAFQAVQMTGNQRCRSMRRPRRHDGEQQRAYEDD